LPPLLSGEGRLWWHICGVEYAKVDRQDDRDGIEKFLYDHYRPECNEVNPLAVARQTVRSADTCAT